MRELPCAARSLSASVTALKKQLEELDAEIARVAERSPIASVAGRLRAMPGVGPMSSVAFASRLVAKDFARPGQWIAYCGLDVTSRQSGKRKGELGLTKQVAAELPLSSLPPPLPPHALQSINRCVALAIGCVLAIKSPAHHTAHSVLQ